MMRAALALLLAPLLGCLFVSAQEPARGGGTTESVSLKSYGDPAGRFLQTLAERLKLKLLLPEDTSPSDWDTVCWVHTGELSYARAGEVLSVAVGLSVSIDRGAGALIVRESSSRPRKRVKGYEVEALAGRFVAYIDDYGAEVKEDASRAKKQTEEQTATEHLLDLVDELLWREAWGDENGAAVGNRLLFSLDDSGHAEVQELLDLLLKEGPGASRELQARMVTAERLQSASWSGAYEETPVGSIVAALCKRAGVDFVAGAELAYLLSEEHVDFQRKRPAKVAALLDLLGKQHEFVRRGVAGGSVLYLQQKDEVEARGSYRVFEVADLMKELEEAYKSQRTKAGKRNGFAGDLRRKGGIAVILDALEAQLEAIGQAPFVLNYGTRVIVSGSPATVAGAATALKEMGWKEPGK